MTAGYVYGCDDWDAECECVCARTHARLIFGLVQCDGFHDIHSLSQCG